MEGWFPLGAQLVCQTCLGTEIEGLLCAYDISQKLMILRKIKNENRICTQNGDLEDHNGSQAARVNSQVSNSSKIENTHDYVMINLNCISSISHVNENVGSTTSQIYIEPPSKLDLVKIKQKLAKNCDDKMRHAKLAGLGVTQDGLDLIEKLKMTLGSQPSNVRWDKNGNIQVFNEVIITRPFTSAHASLRSKESGNRQTLTHVKNVIDKFYKDKEMLKIQLEQQKLQQTTAQETPIYDIPSTTPAAAASNSTITTAVVDSTLDKQNLATITNSASVVTTNVTNLTTK